MSKYKVISTIHKDIGDRSEITLVFDKKASEEDVHVLIHTYHGQEISVNGLWERTTTWDAGL